jgi:hypothetical protein
MPTFPGPTSREPTLAKPSLTAPTFKELICREPIFGDADLRKAILCGTALQNVASFCRAKLDTEVLYQEDSEVLRTVEGAARLNQP